LAFLETVRSAYIAQYEAAYQEGTSEETPLSPEVAFSGVSNVYQNLYVIDFVQQLPDGPAAVEITVEPDQYLDGEDFQFRGMRVEFGDVSWHDVVLRFPASDTSIDGFNTWFERWIDVSLPHAVDGELVSSTIHSALLTEEFIFVDFGTAPTSAFVELLDLMAEQGTTHVQIGHLDWMR